VGAALIVEYYRRLPHRRAKDDPERWRRRQDEAQAAFQKQVRRRYTEGTLLRLLEGPDARARRASLLALGLLGTMEANAAVAARLRDDNAEVRQMAVDTLWALWFRAGAEEDNQELQRLVRLRDREKALAGLDRLIAKAPDFAEAYNQRAILAFRLHQFERSVADCEKVLQLNPYHFGAQAGMAQCYMQLRKHRQALKAFRAALRINPHLDGVAETVRTLEAALGEEGRKNEG
jgi:tetratricopeptide (TPR) repeat protein